MESNIQIINHFDSHTKPFCVLGVLLTNEGINIKNDMLSWLSKEYDVITVEQIAPGILYEFPAINYAIEIVNKYNEYCLYLHTKGAANQGPIQEKIRNMWKNEFIDNKNEYIKLLNQYKKESIILCPFTGNDKNTWFNGFYINQLAAKNTQKLTSKVRRHYWENMYKDNNNVKIIGRIFNNINNIKDDKNIHYLLKYIKDNY